MMDKADKYNGAKWLTSEDEFKAPNLDFKKERIFDELCNDESNICWPRTQNCTEIFLFQQQICNIPARKGNTLLCNENRGCKGSTKINSEDYKWLK